MVLVTYLQSDYLSIFLAMYFIFGNPLYYKVIEKETNEYLHTIKGYKQKEIQSITGKYTPFIISAIMQQ